MKRIGALIYDVVNDCYVVRYNVSVCMPVPEGAKLLMLGGTAWIDVKLIRSRFWRNWRLLGICSGDMTGVCVIIDIDDEGRYLPNMEPLPWEKGRIKNEQKTKKI